MLNAFRLLSLVEGLSLVLLLLVAMPLKYYFAMPTMVSYVGMIHGVLFLLYVLFSIVVSDQQKWSVLFWVFVLVCSLIPFACIILEKQLSKKMAQNA